MPPKSAQEPSEPQIQLSKVPASVVHIHFDGVRHTSRDLLRKQVRHLFDPAISNFEAMMAAADVARERLKQLGVFADMELLIDAPRPEAPDTYDVIFAVKEHKRLRMGISAVSSLDNRASLVSRGALANLTGGAERFEVDWHFGMNRFDEQQRHLTFVKPLEDMPSVKFTAGLFDSASDLSWVQMKEHCRGAFMGVRWPTFAGDHSLRLEGQWRHLAAATGALAMPIPLRSECGHFLRWGLRHDFRADGRDDQILPMRGGLAKVRQELAMGGAGQDQAHLLHDVELQWNVPLHENPKTGACASLQLTHSMGLIRAISANQHIGVSDRFFLGGPMSLRGFEMRQVGPLIDECAPKNSNFPHGGRAYALSGLHLYSSLPYIGGRGFLQNLRLHGFLSTGVLTTREPCWSEPKRMARFIANESRVSTGIGLVLRLFGVARLEINYCWPLVSHTSDKLNPGLQCGVGMEYQ